MTLESLFGKMPVIVRNTQWPKANRPDLTFWFSIFRPFLVEVPKGDHLLFLGPLGK